MGGEKPAQSPAGMPELKRVGKEKSFGVRSWEGYASAYRQDGRESEIPCI